MLIRRELEEAAKVLGDRVRQGSGTAEDFFELGVILLRKKLYTQVGGRAGGWAHGRVGGLGGWVGGRPGVGWMGRRVGGWMGVSTAHPCEERPAPCIPAPPSPPLPPTMELGQATKNLERAKKEWEGEPEELAQVCARACASVCACPCVRACVL